jgi:hypothetical protein
MCAAQHCSTLFISILQQPDRCQCTTLNSNDERYQEWPIGNTSNMSNHFRYRKYKFSVYFGIKIGVGINQYRSSKYRYQIKNPGIAHHYWHARTHRASEPNPTTNPIPNYSGGSSVLHNYINWFNWVQDSVPPLTCHPGGWRDKNYTILDLQSIPWELEEDMAVAHIIASQELSFTWSKFALKYSILYKIYHLVQVQHNNILYTNLETIWSL